MLTEYLDVGHAGHGDRSSFAANGQSALSADLNVHFVKKRPARSHKNALFRFEGSLHSMSLNEMNDKPKLNVSGVEAADRGLIVEPNARLIIEVYQPLVSFVDEIETALGLTNGYATFE